MRQTDGRAITNPENAHSFSHAEIRQAADAMNPAALQGVYDAWSAIATTVTDAGRRFETAVANAVEQHWTGAAADSAARGVRDYAARVSALGEALDAQHAPLAAAASAAAAFKASIPAVVDGAGGNGSPEPRNSREEQARDEMNHRYIQPYGATAPGIPTLPPPIGPATPSPLLPDSRTETATGIGLLIHECGPRTFADRGSGDAGSPDATDTEGKPAEPVRSTDGAIRDDPASPKNGGAQGNSARPTDHRTPDHPAQPTNQDPPNRPAGSIAQGMTEEVAPQSVSQHPDDGMPTAAASATGPQPTARAEPIVPATPTTAAPAVASPPPVVAQTSVSATHASLTGTSTSLTGAPTSLTGAPTSLTGAPTTLTGTPTTPLGTPALPLGTPHAPNTPNSSVPPGASAYPDSQPRPGSAHPQQPTAAPAVQSSAPGRPGTAGVTDYPGPIAPRVRGRGAADDEHTSPKYLRTEEHANELLGETEKTVPPAIGAQ